MFIYGPGIVKPRGEVDDLANVADIAPTLADLVGAKIPENYEFDGINLIPFLSGKTDKHRDWVYSYNGEHKMVRTRDVFLDGIGFYWDTRGTLDQEAYKMIEEDTADPALRNDIAAIKSVLEKYPDAPKSGPMYERYMKEKAGKWELWDKMRKNILRQYKKTGARHFGL